MRAAVCDIKMPLSSAALGTLYMQRGLQAAVGDRGGFSRLVDRCTSACGSQAGLPVEGRKQAVASWPPRDGSTGNQDGASCLAVPSVSG